MHDQHRSAQMSLSGVELTKFYSRTTQVVTWIREVCVTADNMVAESERDHEANSPECAVFEDCEFNPLEHAESWLVSAADDLVHEFKGLRRLFRRCSTAVTEASAILGNCPVQYGQFCAASAHEAVILAAAWADDVLQRLGVVDPHGALGKILVETGEEPEQDLKRASQMLSRGLQGPVDAEQFILARLQVEHSRAQTILGKPQSTDETQWSRPLSPKELVNRFGMSWDALKPKIDSGKIRAIKLSTKSYRIHSADLPPE